MAAKEETASRENIEVLLPLPEGHRVMAHGVGTNCPPLV